MDDKNIFKLLKKGEKLQDRMRKVLRKNNLENFQIEYLPKDDFEEWKALYEQSIILTKEISSLIENENFLKRNTVLNFKKNNQL